MIHLRCYGESEVSSRQGMALALRNITPAQGLGGAEDEYRCNSEKKDLLDSMNRVLEKVAKEVGVEHILAGMCSHAL